MIYSERKQITGQDQATWGELSVCAHRGRDSGQVKVVPAWGYKSTSRLFCSFLFIWFFQLFQKLCICTIEKKNLRKTQDTWKSYSFIFGSALPARTPEAGKFFWSLACTPCQTRTFSQVQGSVLLHPQPGGTRRSVSFVVLTARVRAQSCLTLWPHGL